MKIEPVRIMKCEFGHEKKYSLCPSCEKVRTMVVDGTVEPGDKIEVSCSVSETPPIEMKLQRKSLYGEDKWEDISGVTSVNFNNSFEVEEFINDIEPGKLSTMQPGFKIEVDSSKCVEGLEEIKKRLEYLKEPKELSGPTSIYKNYAEAIQNIRKEHNE